MIFQYTWEKVLAGQKTQTRRIKKPGEELFEREWSLFGNGEYDWIETYVLAPNKAHGEAIKWQVGRTYAVQPGRGKPAVGRIKITAIRKELLTEITEEDAKAEGMTSDYWDRLPSYKSRVDPRYLHCSAYADLWDTIHKQGPYFEDDPLVWVLEFERVPEPEPA